MIPRLVKTPGVCGRLVGVEPWLGVGYDGAVSDGEVRVGKAYNLCRVYNPFEWSVSSVWTGYGVDISTS